MNRILKKIAEDYEELDEEKRIAKALKDLGFERCTTGGRCDAYFKNIGDDKTMYVVGKMETQIPTTFDEPYSVAIFEGEGTDNERELFASFDNYEDFIANYNDMSKYEEIEY